jgi:signal transduction histidine kinase
MREQSFPERAEVAMGLRQPAAGARCRHVLSESARHEILEDLERRLREMDSPIIGDREAIAQLRLQVGAVLDDVVGEPPAETPHAPGTGVLAATIGTTRAVHGVHPTESLWAATALFEAALPVLTRECTDPADAVGGATRVMLRLHRMIMARVVQAAVPYVNFLLSKLYSSHREERERIARELHDRAAHAVGVGLQNLELYEIYSGRETDRAAQKFQAAEDALREALQTIRQLSTELRGSACAQGLEHALRRYLQLNVPADMQVRFSAEGDTSMLMDEVCEELYLVLREAVRNAVLHGKASTLSVDMKVTDAELRAEVGDDGIGFDVAGTVHRAVDNGNTSPVGAGLISMRERLELLGGTLTISSEAGVGTTVTARLPLSRALT